MWTETSVFRLTPVGAGVPYTKGFPRAMSSIEGSIHCLGVGGREHLLPGRTPDLVRALERVVLRRQGPGHDAPVLVKEIRSLGLNVELTESKQSE